MKFSIDPKLQQQFPQLHITTITASNVNNSGTSQRIYQLFSEQISKISNAWNQGRIETEPVFQLWRDAYRLFGAKPKKYRCSIENLYRMIVEGVELRSINPLVDAYNYISLKYCIPVGGDDLQNIAGAVQLTYAKGDEPFTQLNSQEITYAKPGEVIYVDDEKIVCRRWNWRECDQTKITPETTQVMLYLEDIGGHSIQHLQQAQEELSQLLTDELGAHFLTLECTER